MAQIELINIWLLDNGFAPIEALLFVNFITFGALAVAICMMKAFGGRILPFLPLLSLGVLVPNFLHPLFYYFFKRGYGLHAVFILPLLITGLFALTLFISWRWYYGTE